MTKLNKKQRDFLDEILNNRSSVELASDKLNISSDCLCKWFASPEFTEELARRLELIIKRADMLISQNRLTAAEKLINLTSCEKEETARKACLDILELTATITDKNHKPQQKIDPKLAAKLLSILAESENNPKKDSNLVNG